MKSLKYTDSLNNLEDSLTKSLASWTTKTGYKNLRAKYKQTLIATQRGKHLSNRHKFLSFLTTYEMTMAKSPSTTALDKPKALVLQNQKFNLNSRTFTCRFRVSFLSLYLDVSSQFTCPKSPKVLKSSTRVSTWQTLWLAMTILDRYSQPISWSCIHGSQVFKGVHFKASLIMAQREDEE